MILPGFETFIRVVTLLITVEIKDVAQVACGLFVHLAFNFDRVGLSPFGPSRELQRREH